MTLFTADDVIRALETVVAETGPNYVYLHHFDTCKYVQTPYDANPGQPACIVGRVLDILGVPQPEENAATFRQTEAVNHFDDLARVILHSAQACQDSAETVEWGSYGVILEWVKTL